MAKPLIALDADGVLLDFHLGYADAWRRAFGEAPRERDPLAYWPIDRWHVTRLDDAGRAHFRRYFDMQFWETVPAIDGAVEACQRLHDAGHLLVCVSALDSEFEAARLRNLRDHGFPIERVVATGNATSERSPKADFIASLQPIAFVDDYLPYFRGVPEGVHRALIMRGPTGTPNTGAELDETHSRHADLAAFASSWLSSGPEGPAPPAPRHRTNVRRR